MLRKYLGYTSNESSNPINIFQPIGGHNPNQIPFAITVRGTTISSVDLAGSYPGNILSGGPIWVDNVYGIGGEYSRDDNSNTYTNLTVTIGLRIAGALVFIGGILFLCIFSSRRRRLRVKRSMGKTDEHHSSIEICNALGDPAGAPISDKDETARWRPSPEGYDLRQPVGLSCHPRPTVATTIGGSV